MSGLTPILDTLLTQVLGKRGDVRPARALQPGQVVTEVRGAPPERGPESDSRLDPRGDGTSSRAAGQNPLSRAEGARAPIRPAGAEESTGSAHRPGTADAGRGFSTDGPNARPAH